MPTANNITITADNFVASYTNASLLTAISTNSLIAGQTVIVTDAIYTTFFNSILIEVCLEALSTNTISTKGSGTFLNADYQTVGNYTGVALFTGQTGVYNALTSYTIGKVCIYNNLHYKAIAVSLGNLPTNPAFWVLLAYTGAPALLNGYIKEIDIINYNVSNNNIFYREDKRKNRVYSNKLINVNTSFALFQFGKDTVNENYIFNDSSVDIVNSTGQFSFNVLDTSNLTGYISGNVNQNFGTIHSNNFKNTELKYRNSNASSSINKNNFVDNVTFLTIDNANNSTFYSNDICNNSSFKIENFGFINRNKIYRTVGGTIGVQLSALFNNNSFDTCTFSFFVTTNMRYNIFVKSIFILTNTAIAPSLFENNQIINCGNITFTNAGNFENNIIDDTKFIGNNQDAFTNNKIKNCDFGLSINFGAVTDNIIQQTTINISSFQLLSGSEFSYNTINNSNIVFGGDLSARFNNNFIISSQIEYFSTIDQFFENNSVTNTTLFFTTPQIRIFGNNVLTQCDIYNYLGVLDLENNNWNQVFFHASDNVTSPKNTTINEGKYLYDVNFPYLTNLGLGGVCADGISTLTVNLDLFDPLVYDAGTQVLTIPPAISSWYGIFLLQNANLQNILKINGLSKVFNTTFRLFSFGYVGYVTFFSTSVGIATSGDILSELGSNAYKVDASFGAIDYSDEITLNREHLTVGRVCKIVNVAIMT